MDNLSKAARDVIAERQRQQAEEGWTTEHDDEHADGELARAAGLYALVAGVEETNYRNACDGYYPGDYLAAAMNYWPWHFSWFKPTTRRRTLEKAGALIIAEIERLDRLEDKTDG